MSWYHSLTLAQSDAAPPAPGGNGNGGAAPAPSAPAAPGNGEAGEGVPVAPDGQGAPGEQQQQPQGSMLSFFMPLIILLAVFWLLILVPQRREKKKRAEMLNAIKKGDKVQTIGGILGSVIEVREHEIILKVDESANTRMRFARGAIQTILPDGKPQETN